MTVRLDLRRYICSSKFLIPDTFLAEISKWLGQIAPSPDSFGCIIAWIFNKSCMTSLPRNAYVAPGLIVTRFFETKSGEAFDTVFRFACPHACCALRMLSLLF